MSNLEFSDSIMKNEIKDDLQLFSIAKVQKEEGKTDLAEFILNRNSKSLREIIESTWKMESAGRDLIRKNKLRMDVIREAVDSNCADECQGK